MAVLLALLVGAAASAAVLTFAFALGLHRSDAAGNGLAQAWMLAATAITTALVAAALGTAWLLDAPPPAAAARGAATASCFAAILGLPLAALPCLFAPAAGPRRRAVVAALTTLTWLGALAHAAWRGFALDLPHALAAWGPCLLALAAITIALAFGRTPAARSRPNPFTMAWPGLVLREGDAVVVVRDAAALATLDPSLFTRTPPPLTIDANGSVWSLQPAADVAAWPTARTDRTLPIDAVRALVLAIPRLHANATADAELRRLVAMQTSVTALTFVLPH